MPIDWAPAGTAPGRRPAVFLPGEAGVEVGREEAGAAGSQRAPGLSPRRGIIGGKILYLPACGRPCLPTLFLCIRV